MKKNYELFFAEVYLSFHLFNSQFDLINYVCSNELFIFTDWILFYMLQILVLIFLHVHCCGIFIFILKIKKIWKCGLKKINAISVNLRALDVLFLQHFWRLAVVKLKKFSFSVSRCIANGGFSPLLRIFFSLVWFLRKRSLKIANRKILDTLLTQTVSKDSHFEIRLNNLKNKISNNHTRDRPLPEGILEVIGLQVSAFSTNWDNFGWF